MNIERLGVRITDVPGMKSIEVKQDSASEHGVHIVLDSDFTWSEMRGELMPQSYSLAGAKQLRDALSVAIEHVEQMAGAPPAPAFTVGQQLDGTEDLPIGTVAKDSDPNKPDTWTFRGDLWETADGGTMSVNHWRETVQRYAPVTIVSLP